MTMKPLTPDDLDRAELLALVRNLVGFAPWRLTQGDLLRVRIESLLAKASEAFERYMALEGEATKAWQAHTEASDACHAAAIGRAAVATYNRLRRKACDADDALELARARAKRALAHYKRLTKVADDLSLKLREIGE